MANVIVVAVLRTQVRNSQFILHGAMWPFFFEINTKHINTLWAERTFFIVKPVGASSTQSNLKGKLTILQDLISFIEHIDNTGKQISKNVLYL